MSKMHKSLRISFMLEEWVRVCCIRCFQFLEVVGVNTDTMICTGCEKFVSHNYVHKDNAFKK